MGQKVLFLEQQHVFARRGETMTQLITWLEHVITQSRWNGLSVRAVTLVRSEIVGRL